MATATMDCNLTFMFCFANKEFLIICDHDNVENIYEQFIAIQKGWA